MSATPQRFEGSSIEEVLGRVRAELGHDAEIIEANRVRSGGLAGFFAKEAFEVVAAPSTGDSGRSPAPTGPAPTGANGLMDLVERISAAERREDDAPPAPEAPVMTRAQHVAQQVMAEHLGRGGPVGQAPSSDANGFEPLQPAEMPRLSTEAPAFTEVLQRIATEAGPEIAQAIEDRLPRPLMPVGPASVTRAASTAAITAPQVAPSPTPADQSVEVSATDLATVEAPAAPALRPEQEMTRTERLLSWLERDHLPRTTLLSALRGLPQMEPLPTTRGVVVAIVGDRQRALRLARQLARACDADPTSVVLASSYGGGAVPAAQRIVEETDAIADRQSWRRRDAPTFVAVDSPSSPRADQQGWARGVIAALDAHRVIGIVAATRKNDDIRSWADAVGGVDGLALVATHETTTPYEVLALEIPIAFLDDEPATPGVWAQALLDGVAA